MLFCMNPSMCPQHSSHEIQTPPHGLQGPAWSAPFAFLASFCTIPALPAHAPATLPFFLFLQHARLLPGQNQVRS